MKITNLDKSSFFDISEYMNEDFNILKIKNNITEVQEKKFNNSDLEINKNEYDYIARIKENSILKRENEELKCQLNELLVGRNKFKENVITSSS